MALQRNAMDYPKKLALLASIRFTRSCVYSLIRVLSQTCLVLIFIINHHIQETVNEWRDDWISEWINGGVSKKVIKWVREWIDEWVHG